jgi:hypothetical protein
VVDHRLYTFTVTFSTSDYAFIAHCVEFPSLSHLDPDPELALAGMRNLVESCLLDLEAEGSVAPSPTGVGVNYTRSPATTIESGPRHSPSPTGVGLNHTQAATVSSSMEGSGPAVSVGPPQPAVSVEPATPLEQEAALQELHALAGFVAAELKALQGSQDHAHTRTAPPRVPAAPIRLEALEALQALLRRWAALPQEPLPVYYCQHCGGGLQQGERMVGQVYAEWLTEYNALMDATEIALAPRPVDEEQ